MAGNRVPARALRDGGRMPGPHGLPFGALPPRHPLLSSARGPPPIPESAGRWQEVGAEPSLPQEQLPPHCSALLPFPSVLRPPPPPRFVGPALPAPLPSPAPAPPFPTRQPEAESRCGAAGRAGEQVGRVRRSRSHATHPGHQGQG